jgi:carboxymethylenebutenolidase
VCHETCPHPISGGDYLRESRVTIDVDGEDLPVFVVTPDTTPAPGVMIIHDIYGPGEFYQDLARRLADAGYLVALPDFYVRQPPIPGRDMDAARARGAKVVQGKTFADMATSLAWLRDHEDGTGKIGTIGMCWGGSMAMLQASRQPRPHASIPFYGFPIRPRTENNPVLAMDEDEVTRVDSPMLAFWGDEDHGVGMDNVAAYDDMLTAHDKDHEFVIYPGIGHGFLTFDPDADAYEASQDAWSRTLAFLAEHLGTSGTA